MSGHRFKTAFILGAGLGTRLRPLTEHCPKPLLPLGNRPVIAYAMDHLLEAGIERFIINTHHCPDAFEREFPDRHWRGRPILFRYEPVLLDTAGGLKNIEDLLSEDEAIVCYNGDILTDFPLRTLLEFHAKKKADATLALRSSGPLLNVEIDEHGTICDIRNSLQRRGVKSCLFTGIYTVETTILRYIEKDRVESIVSTFLERITTRPGSIAGIVIDDGDWHDVGSIQEYQQLKNRLSPQEKQ